MRVKKIYTLLKKYNYAYNLQKTEENENSIESYLSQN